MQVNTSRISNQERSEAMRSALIAAARKLFVEKGFADTGTPEIVAAASVTRGALYHHFHDKSDLFLAVARQAAQEVADEIARSTRSVGSPVDGMIKGSNAYFAAMAEGGRARLLLLEAPSILDRASLAELSEVAGERELATGLAAVLSSTPEHEAPRAELTKLISAAFDSAALAIANGESRKRYKAAINFLLKNLASSES